MSEMRQLPSDPEQGGSFLDGVIRFCLENKLVVVLFIVGAVIWGLSAAPFDWHFKYLPRNPVPVDAIPDIGENQQIVFTDWMGRSPQDVEDQITYPLTTALLGIPDVKTVRSYSMFGFSTIYVIFDEKAEFYWSRSRVLEKLNSLAPGTLPAGVQPMLGPDATALGQVYWYTLEGRDPDGKPAGGWDLQQLRSIQDWYVRYPLLAAGGISDVASVGGYVKEYQIDVDPDAMRSYGVTLEQVFNAVRMSNVDVGARTIEVNKVEYVIRGLGFIKKVSDLEDTVIKENKNVPVLVRNVAHVSLGPDLRRGALDKEGAEAVGGVAVVRYGFNPLEAINNLKAKIKEIEPGLPTKVVIDWDKVSRQQVTQYAAAHGFEAFASPDIDQTAWLSYLRDTPRDQWPAWVTTSHVTVVPFYDRTGLIYETLGTLNDALAQEILVTVIVVIISVFHMRSSILISGTLPLVVLMCFILMKIAHVDANIVALSGIAIAIGTIVDMSIIICENILKHLAQAPPDEDRLSVVFRATSEVGSAVVTAVSTTVVSFLPVFFMTGPEGKLFKPLAFTKTFALASSVLIALLIVPAGAHVLFAQKVRTGFVKRLFLGAAVAAGIALAVWQGWWWAGAVIVLLAGYHLIAERLPEKWRNLGPYVANGLAAAIVIYLLTVYWEPLGPDRGVVRNLVFVGGIIGVLMGFFIVVRYFYGPTLRVLLRHKIAFTLFPVVLTVVGLWYVWLGPASIFGPAPKEGLPAVTDFSSPGDEAALKSAGLLVPSENHPEQLAWKTKGMTIKSFMDAAQRAGVRDVQYDTRRWLKTQSLPDLADLNWAYPERPGEIGINRTGLGVIARWTLARDWNGRGKEFMPPLDEGSYLLMPTTMPHASIGESLDLLHLQDKAIRAIPEVESVVGKLGRAETPLDPAPISMVETVISYKPEYMTDKAGRRMTFKYDEQGGSFVRDAKGELIEDPDGRPYRQWRDSIKKPGDIWDAILKAAEIPGMTGAPKLQPIAARVVMLQSGMRAPMGVKVMGPDLRTIEQVGLQLERLLKQVPSVEPDAVIADRVVGKPYVEITPNRQAMARYGLSERAVQDVIEVAIGGTPITTTVEGRERYPVAVRYERELRDNIESLGGILVSAMDGTQIPLREVADIRYVRGPEMIKSEDGQLVGYVLFDIKPGHAEVNVVDDCQRYLQQKIASGEFVLPAGVSYKFAGNYENQIHARKTLAVVLPLALFVIFLILYFQFKSVPTTMLVFSGIGVAWAGGFLLIWLYAQPWFMNFSVFGEPLRDLFQVHTINLSVAVWVGFLALFGIASDNGVVIATYLDQSFARHQPGTIGEIRDATVAGAVRRIRPCLMTSATTILALIPVLTSVGRGSDVMVPMAIPSFGGMMVVLVSVFATPVFYCAIKEFRHQTGWSSIAVGGLLAVTLFVPGMIAMMAYTAIAGRRQRTA
jgi:Cu(I)/Ag(I) efflux system membrane protein CusA/SilA